MEEKRESIYEAVFIRCHMSWWARSRRDKKDPSTRFVYVSTSFDCSQNSNSDFNTYDNSNGSSNFTGDNELVYTKSFGSTSWAQMTIGHAWKDHPHVVSGKSFFWTTAAHRALCASNSLGWSKQERNSYRLLRGKRNIAAKKTGELAKVNRQRVHNHRLPVINNMVVRLIQKGLTMTSPFSTL